MALLTLKQAAKQLGITADTLRAQIRKERLRATKLGRDWLVEGAEVTLLHEGLFGRDPIAVKLDDMRVALRRREASQVFIRRSGRRG